MLTHRGVPRNPVARSHHILRQETLPALELLPLIPSVTHRTSPITTWGSPDEPSPGFEPGTRSWQERGVANYAHNGRSRASQPVTLPLRGLHHTCPCVPPGAGQAGRAPQANRLDNHQNPILPMLTGPEPSPTGAVPFCPVEDFSFGGFSPSGSSATSHPFSTPQIRGKMLFRHPLSSF